MIRGKNTIWTMAVAGTLLVACEAGEETSTLVPNPSFTHMTATPGAQNDLNTDLVVSGSGIVADGVGLSGVEMGSITVNVPAGATVTRALLYWGARFEMEEPSLMKATKAPTTEDLVGDLIGRSDGGLTVAFRADVTTDFTWSAGANTVDLDVTQDPGGDGLPDYNGASLVLVYDDGTGGSIEIRDGDDFGYLLADPGVDQDMVPQTFTFPAYGASRTAQLWTIANDVEEARPNHLDITVDGVTTTIESPWGDG